MPSTRRDRNLLFGALAWRVGLLDHDGALQLARSDAADGSSDASEIAIQRGWMNADQCRAVEAVLACQMAAFDADPAKCLEALAADTFRAERARAGSEDPDATAAVSSTRGSGVEIPESTMSPTAETAEMPQRFQAPTPQRDSAPRFRLIRPHAAGGLGVVWLALDRELDRHVALKEMKGTVSNETRGRARFLREAEITGKLEHPGIVSIYSLGSHPDGRPYYAMRFVDGESLKDAIARHHNDPGAAPGRNPGLCALLGRFVDVCEAIAYAHSRGVMHRDLKPSNVMLAPYGETLVVDWGLAKATGHAAADRGTAAAIDAARVMERRADPSGTTPTEASTVASQAAVRLAIAPGDEALTEAGVVLGTRFFMSPEQALGDVDQLGPASDIYGLGAILYTILTGRMPQEVWAGSASPRAVSPDVPRALDLICQKAMAVLPEARYASAAALADDVQRWLRDESLIGVSEPWFDRAWRVLRRHRGLAATAALALIVVLGTLAWAYARQVADAATLSRLNRELSVSHARTEEARRLASVRLDRAMAALRDTVTEAAVVLRAAPAAAPARLVARPRRFFENLLREVEHRASDLDREHAIVAEGRLGLGRIDELLGDLAGARRQYENAIGALSQIADDGHDDARDSARLAELHGHLGNVLNALGEPTSAASAFRKAIAHHRAPPSPEPAQPDARAALDRHYEGLGAALRSVRAAREAAQVARDRLALWPPQDSAALARAALEVAACADVLPIDGAGQRALRNEYQSEAYALMRRALEAAGQSSSSGGDSATPRALLLRWLDSRWPEHPFVQP